MTQKVAERAKDVLDAVALRGAIEVAEKQVVLALAEDGTIDFLKGLENVRGTLKAAERRLDAMSKKAQEKMREEYGERKAAEHAAKVAEFRDVVCGAGKSADVTRTMEEAGAQKAGRLLHLLEEVERRALELSGGHVTILKFTTDWKVAFGTPDLDGAAQPTRKWLWEENGFDTLSDAFEDLLATNRRWPTDQKLKAVNNG